MEGKVESRAPYLTSRDFETTWWTKILPEFCFVAAAVKRFAPPPFRKGGGANLWPVSDGHVNRIEKVDRYLCRRPLGGKTVISLSPLAAYK